MRWRALAARAAFAALALGATPLQATEEVPFVVTPDNVTVAMLELARVTPRDVVLDLGSGDGRIVITAAKRFGARGLGVEIVPDLVERSRRNAEAAGVGDRARFVVQDLLQTDLAQASVITMYLLPDLNLQLRPRLLTLAPGTRVVSHDWDMADWAPDAVRVVDAPDKTIDREKRSRLYLWVVPARLQGAWCGAGTRLRLEQHHQRITGTVESGGSAQPLRGRVDGGRLHTGLFEATAVDGALVLAHGHVGRLRPGARLDRCAD